MYIQTAPFSVCGDINWLSSVFAKCKESRKKPDADAVRIWTGCGNIRKHVTRI